MRCSGPIDQPSFQPVTLNVLPALPIVIVLSHIPGNVAEMYHYTNIYHLKIDMLSEKYLLVIIYHLNLLHSEAMAANFK